MNRRYKTTIWERDGWVCRYCGCTVEVPPSGDLAGAPPPNMATVDHVHPRSAGGSNRAGNLVTACYRCNILKGDHLHGGRFGFSRQSLGLPEREPTLADVWPDLAPHEKALLRSGRGGT